MARVKRDTVSRAALATSPNWLFRSAFITVATGYRSPLTGPCGSLMIGRRRGRERVVNALIRPVGRVNKSDDVLFDINRLKQEVFVGRLADVFAKDLFSAVETPHEESRV